MAVSGSTDFNLTRDEIIESALRKLGVLAEGQSATANQKTTASEQLNVIVKGLQREGIGLWAIEWVQEVLSTVSSQVEGSDGLQYKCIKSHTSATADNKPITGTNWQTFWRQTGSGGAAWADATGYTSIGQVTLDTDTIWIEKAYIRRDQTDHELEIVSFDRYQREITKWSVGLPSMISLHRLLTSVEAYMYPMEDRITTPYDTLHCLKYRKLNDFDAGSDDPDAPVMWLDMLIWGLAYELAFEYPAVPTSKRRDIRDEATRQFRLVKMGDYEIESSRQLTPAYPVRRR